MRVSLPALLLLLLATSAVAASRYVDDQLVITLRTGKGNSYQILRTLPSGTQLELLAEEDSYSKVRTPDGTEGWVLSQYLSESPVARQRLARAEQQLGQLREERQGLQRQLAALTEEKKGLEREQQQLAGETQQLRSELESLRQVAARPIELAQQNSALNDRLEQLQRETVELQATNTTLEDRSRRDWFLAGAGVLFGGILLGLLLPRMRRKKRGMFE